MTNFISGFLAEEQVYYVFTSSRRRLFVNTKTTVNDYRLTFTVYRLTITVYRRRELCSGAAGYWLLAIGCWLLVFNSQPSRLLFPSASELRFVPASACKLAYNAQRAQPKLNNAVVNPKP